MPDNNGGILGGLSNFFGGIGGPTYLANVQRQQLELAMQRYQMELYQQQMLEQLGPGPNNPRMSYGQAAYNIQHPEIQYGLPQYGQPIEGEGFKVPTGFYHGQPFVGMPPGPNAPQPQPQTMAPQAAGTAGAPPGLQAIQPYIDYFQQQKAKTAGQVKQAETAAQGAPAFPAALSEAHQRIAQLIAIRDHPNLEKVVGRFAGATPAQYSADPDLVSAIDTANAALKGQTFQTIRAPSGRPISPGAIKEMAIGDLSESRRGSAEGMRSEINRIIGQIQKETEASWEGVNSPPEYKPVWGKNEMPQSPGAGSAPNDRAVQFLRAHPEHAHQFDAKFGRGASQKVLGNAQRL